MRLVAYAEAGAEPRPDASAVPLVEPAVSMVVNDHDISCMIIYWIGLPS